MASRHSPRRGKSRDVGCVRTVGCVFVNIDPGVALGN